MSALKWQGRRVERCANEACPNKAHEGQFVVIETTEPVVGGHRPIRLTMCVPCADVLREATS